MTGPSYGQGAKSALFIISDEDKAGSDAYRFLRESGALAEKPRRLDEAAMDKLSGRLWIELTRDSEGLDGWLDRLRAATAGVPTTLVVPEALTDLAVAKGDGELTEILIDPDRADRLTALALMNERDAMIGGKGMEANQNGDDRALRKLSEEVARIAATLSRLTDERDFTPSRATQKPAGDAPEVDAETVRMTIRARRLREDFFAAELFADPAWDMLLDLLGAEIAQIRVPVSSLCSAAAVPPTTALRWMKTMTDKGLFRRVPDPHDGRRVFIELAPEASLAMRHYFDALGDRIAA